MSTVHWKQGSQVVFFRYCLCMCHFSYISGNNRVRNYNSQVICATFHTS